MATIAASGWPPREQLFALLFVGAAFSWLGVYSDAWGLQNELPYLRARGVSLQGFVAAQSVEDLPFQLKVLLALPLDAGLCCSRVCGVTLGLRRPMILLGQLLAAGLFALNLVIDPAAALPLYTAVGFGRQLGVVMVAIAIEGYAMDAGTAAFGGREALPAAALQIGRNLASTIGALAGGKLADDFGFVALIYLFLAMTLVTLPLTVAAKEYRTVPRRSPEAGPSLPPKAATAAAGAANADAASAADAQFAANTSATAAQAPAEAPASPLVCRAATALARLVPLRLIFAWLVRPPVFLFLLFFSVAFVGQNSGQVLAATFMIETRGVSLFELGQLNSTQNAVSLVFNVPVAYLLDRFVLRSAARLRVVIAGTLLAGAGVTAAFLATPEGAAGKPGLYAVHVGLGVVQALTNMLYFALLLRTCDKRFAATAFSIATMITNSAGGTAAKQVSSAILSSTPGGDIAGIRRCMWIGACIAAGAALPGLLFALPSVEEQARLDGEEGPRDPAAAGAAAAAGQGDNQVVVANPFLARRERVVGMAAPPAAPAQALMLPEWVR